MTRFYFRFGLATLVLLLMTLFARAQGMVVSGKVTDETGSALPGVNVIIKGSMTGSTTDADGNYSIGNVTNSSTLVFSFIGYATREVEVANRTVIDVQLVNDVTALDEVVVVGYGTSLKKKRNYLHRTGRSYQDSKCGKFRSV